MYDGYMTFGGTEVINADRTAAYARSLVPRFGLKHTCGCAGLEYVVNRPDVFEVGPEGRTAAQIRAASAYRSPMLDKPDWFDPNDQDTWGFAGLYPLSIVGIDSSSRTATVQENNLNGGVVQRTRLATKDIRVSGLLIADSPRSLMAGFRWLDSALEGDGCSDCGGSSLCYLSACPDCISLTGIDYLSPPKSFQVGGSTGWRAQGGGTYTQDIPNHRGTWAPNSMQSYLEFSPMNAVCDDMAFTVGFPESSAPPIVQRRNLVENPRYGRTVGTEVVRRNMAINPTGGTALTRWTRTVVGNGTSTFNRVNDTSLNVARSVPVSTTLRETWSTLATLSTAGSYIQHGTPLQDGATSGIPVNDTKPFVASMYVYSTFLTGARISVLFYDGSGVQVGSTFLGNVINPNGSWTRANVVVPTIPGGASVAVVRIGGTTGELPDAGSYNAYGALLVEQTKVVGRYFDGNTSLDDRGWSSSWNGLAGQSVSSLSAPVPTKTLVHFNDFPSGSDLPATVGGRSTEPTPPGVPSTQPYTYTVMLLNTPANSIIANTPRLNLNPADFAAGKLQARIGAVASATVQASIVAVDTNNVVLATLATSAATTLITTDWVTLDVPATTVAPTGTVGCALRVSVVGAPVGDEVVEFRNLLVQPTTVVGPVGVFFSGATTDTATIDYAWAGAADDSQSLALVINPLVRPLKLQAFGDGVTLVGEAIGNTTSDLTVTIDGTPWETITYRLLPVDTFGNVILDKVEWSFRVPLGENGYDYDTFTGAYYSPDDGAGAGGGTDDPPGIKVDNDVRKYRRTMRRVSCVSGLTVVEQLDSPSASLMRVEFILTSEVPYRYGEETAAGWLSLNAGNYSDPFLAGDGFPIGTPVPQCDSYEEAYSLVDPNSPTIPDPPRLGGSGSGSLGSPSSGPIFVRPRPGRPPVLIPPGQDGPVVGRYGLRIPSSLIPTSGDVVPILRINGGEASRLTIRFFPTPVENMPLADIDPCSACANIRINYVPSQGMVIDGTEQRAYSVAYESTYSDGEFAGYTGRSFEQQATSLLSSIDGSPLRWPVLSCGVGYMMVVETYGYEIESLGLELTLAARE